MGSQLLDNAVPAMFTMLTCWLSSTWYMYMLQSEVEDAEDSNAPFDDVTHWVGNLPSKDNS